MSAKKSSGYVVRWCGSVCAENPHPTREAAQKWIEEMVAEANRYGGFYSSYTIDEPEPEKQG